jgi:Rrf2 family transcriptional regulator, iron-sulfur cluster assembly transcription factor
MSGSGSSVALDSGCPRCGSLSKDCPPLQENAMRLTTKGRFAVTAMIDLALRENTGPVALAAISARQQISLSYLEQLFGKLRRHELVESTRGPGGGYSLGRKSADITVADIIVAVDEPIDATGCQGRDSCLGEDSGRCMTHDLWASLNAKMIEYLNSISLKKLVDEQLAKGVSVQGQPTRRAISSQPVVKPIKVTAPNSVFALGAALSK